MMKVVDVLVPNSTRFNAAFLLLPVLVGFALAVAPMPVLFVETPPPGVTV